MIEIAGALSAFKAVKDLGKVIYDAQVDAAFKEKVREVLEKIDGAQATLYELRDELLNVQTENLSLKGQLADATDWKAQQAQYKLVETEGGAIVYEFNGDPKHYACPNCMTAKRITPLQDNRTLRGKYRCTHPSCNGAEFPIKKGTTLKPRPDTGGGTAGGWMGN